jgi:hypothetical protein
VAYGRQVSRGKVSREVPCRNSDCRSSRRSNGEWPTSIRGRMTAFRNPRAPRPISVPIIRSIRGCLSMTVGTQPQWYPEAFSAPSAPGGLLAFGWPQAASQIRTTTQSPQESCKGRVQGATSAQSTTIGGRNLQLGLVGANAPIGGGGYNRSKWRSCDRRIRLRLLRRVGSRCQSLNISLRSSWSMRQPR